MKHILGLNYYLPKGLVFLPNELYSWCVSAFLALADKPHFSPFTGLLIFKSSISPFFSGTFVFLSLPSLSSFSLFFFSFPSFWYATFPPSQGCYGDVSFFFFFILGASSNVFSSPSYWSFFCLLFLTGCFSMQRMQPLLCLGGLRCCVYCPSLSLKEPEGGCGWA